MSKENDLSSKQDYKDFSQSVDEALTNVTKDSSNSTTEELREKVQKNDKIQEFMRKLGLKRENSNESIENTKINNSINRVAIDKDYFKKNVAKYKVDYRNGKYIPPSIKCLNNYCVDKDFSNNHNAEFLANRLQDTCNSLGVDVAKVTVESVTSMAVTLLVVLEKGTSFKQIKKIRADLECHLGTIEFGGYGEDTNSFKIIIKKFIDKNYNRPLMGLSDVITSKQFQEAESPLTVAAGYDVRGIPFVFDLAQAPHLLIAGTTGSGKSVFIDDILLSVIFKATPEEVRLLLIDLNMTELIPYNGLPHLLQPVLTSSDEALNGILWAEEEILNRYKILEKIHVKHIDSYNKIAKENGESILPSIIVIIDEFSELMKNNQKELNSSIDRIARLGRAAGVHLVLATQLPVSKIVTPLIKSNIPCRASFMVLDGRESRIILDKTGAERLLGNGDMIFSKSEFEGNVHAQAAYVSEQEVWKVTDNVRTINGINSIEY